MIEPGELHRYFMVRDTARERDLWVLSDTRYTVTDEIRMHYRGDPEGEYFLAELTGRRTPWPLPMRLDEVEPLPDGRGLWHPDAWEHWGNLDRSYEGSWRQYADRARSGEDSSEQGTGAAA